MAEFSLRSAPDMTRRGTLAYYFAAWVCGCFFISIMIWLAPRARPMNFASHSAPLLFYIYFISLIFGAVPSILFGLLLRLAVRSLKWRKLFEWALAGTILAPASLAALAGASSLRIFRGGGWRIWISAALARPYLEGSGSKWVFLLAVPAGAATAWVLFHIDRAFGAP